MRRMLSSQAHGAAVRNTWGRKRTAYSGSCAEQWVENKSCALDVVVSSHTKWHGTGHGEVAPEFLRRNCWTWTADGRCISSVRGGSAEAATPASTLPGEVPMRLVVHTHCWKSDPFASSSGSVQRSDPRVISISRCRARAAAWASREGERCLH
jgi:hypothetical protein